MPETDIPEDDPDVLRVEKSARELMEHFDSIQIIATRYEPDEKETVTISRGIGNWSARYGSVRESMVKMEESFKEGIRRQDDD